MGDWSEITSDPIILSWIKGYKIPLSSLPNQSAPPQENAWSIRENTEIGVIISDLLGMGALEICKPVEEQFISTISLVPKSDGSKRFILNLKNLNKLVKLDHFKLENRSTAERLLILNRKYEKKRKKINSLRAVFANFWVSFLIRERCRCSYQLKNRQILLVN